MAVTDAPPNPQGAGAATPQQRNRPRPPRILLTTTPALVWYAVFTIGPLLGVFVIAVLDWRGLLDTPTFVGLENFARVFTDPTFWTAVRITAIQVVVAVPLMMPLAFMAGYYLNSGPPGRAVLNILFFTPGLISISIKGTMFYGVLAPNGGLNGGLAILGLENLSTPWLADPATALACIIGVELWSGIGWTGVLLSARLASLPAEVFEAADLDGAGRTRKMWSVAFPMAKGYFGTLTMLQFLWTLFSSAPLIIILTAGGPGLSTTTLSFLVFQKAFSSQDLGYSQAVGIVLIVIGIAGMFAIRRSLRPSY